MNLSSITEGIETTVVYWPVKLRESGRVLFFRLQLWDCGENALRRFDHLLPVRMKYTVFSQIQQVVLSYELMLLKITSSHFVSNHYLICLPVV